MKTVSSEPPGEAGPGRARGGGSGNGGGGVNSQLSTALTMAGLDQRFGYKVFRLGKERCFFRFLAGAWHDVTAPRDFGYRADKVLEILQHELSVAGDGWRVTGAELIVFGCCCHACAGEGRGQAAAMELVARGIPADRISHGFWPEHEPAELKYMERQLREITVTA